MSENQLKTTTLTREEWLESLNKNLNKIKNSFSTLDLDEISKNAVQYLSDIPNFGGYMDSPVAFYKGKIIEAKSYHGDDLMAFKEFLINSGKLVFIYDAIWDTSIPKFNKIDNKTDIEVLDHPKYTIPYWFIRYSMIEE